MDIDKLIAKYSLVSDQVDKVEIKIILTELTKVLDIVGDVVEFGCYKGTTSLFLARLLQENKSTKKLWLYDSFAGLPDKTAEDVAVLGTEFRVGELLATKTEVLQNFRHANLPKPIIKKGWFSEVTVDDVPAEIAFAYFDGDYYASIRDSFRACKDRFSDGAIIIIDDYGNDRLPGAAKAVDEWVNNNKLLIKRFRQQNSLAIIELGIRS